MLRDTIINNQRLLETYWSSNTPNNVLQFLCNGGGELVDLNPVKLTCGLIVTQDLITKNVNMYFGMTEISTEGENIKFILDYGLKLEKGSLKNLSELFSINDELKS